MKLVFGFWLVFPAFNGAAYIYENYVRSYVKQYVNWNYPEKQRRLMQLLSLDARKSVERYIDRYGHEAFRRVIESVRNASCFQNDLFSPQYFCSLLSVNLLGDLYQTR